MVARGEVWWSDSPLWGRRPVLILTRAEVVDRLSSIMAAAITTVHRDIPTEVHLDTADGLPRSCVINLDNVMSVPRSFLVERITRLGPDRMNMVCRALGHATGC